MLELARIEDRAAVNELALQVHALHVAWRPDLYRMEEELYSEERMREHLAKRELFVAKIEGNVVGYALLCTRDSRKPGMVPRKVMMLDEICVHEACRGHGIGREMMADIRALARAFGCTDIKLGVYPQNEDAIRFYEASGFMIRSIDMQMKL